MQNNIAFITCVNNDEWYSECLLYLKHLNICLDHVKKGGVILADDVLFFGLVNGDEWVPHKHRTIVTHLREFVKYINSCDELDVKILNEYKNYTKQVQDDKKHGDKLTGIFKVEKSLRKNYPIPNGKLFWIKVQRNCRVSKDKQKTPIVIFIPVINY